MPSLTLSPPLVFGIIASAGIFLFFIGLNQARRAAGGSEDFQNRLAAYGVTTAGAACAAAAATQATSRLLAAARLQ